MGILIWASTDILSARSYYKKKTLLQLDSTPGKNERGSAESSYKDSKPEQLFRGGQGPLVPVDFPVKTITPEDTVVGDIQVQSNGVLLRGHHLAVLPLNQVDTSDLVPVGEQQVRAFTCRRSGRDLEPCPHGRFAFRARLI